jgi:GT2 family glycosyltransferase
MIITVVIPTKNRPSELYTAVQSIIFQEYKINQLLIIDQSDYDDSKCSIKNLLDKNTFINLDYIYNNEINGLVEAKICALKYAVGDLIFFLEDDICLSQNYFSQIIYSFNNYPDMLGCCGIIDNHKQSIIYSFFFNLFHRGIFYDPRIRLNSITSYSSQRPISSPTLSGGMSTWKREVFNYLNFDSTNLFFMMEDIEFSTRAKMFFGDRFFIIPNAKIIHFSSKLNREKEVDRQLRKVFESIIFYKKRRFVPYAFSNLLLLLFGIFCESLLKSLLHCSFIYIINFYKGILFGIRWRLRIL